MAKMRDLRQALKERLDTVVSQPALTAYAKPTGTINLPAAIVLPRPVEFGVTMDNGATLWTFDILVLATMATTALASDLLDDFLDDEGDTSIIAAVEGDPRLGGIADWVVVKGVPAYGPVEYSGKDYLGARFAVEVQTGG